MHRSTALRADEGRACVTPLELVNSVAKTSSHTSAPHACWPGVPSELSLKLRSCHTCRLTYAAIQVAGTFLSARVCQLQGVLVCSRLLTVEASKLCSMCKFV